MTQKQKAIFHCEPRISQKMNFSPLRKVCKELINGFFLPKGADFFIFLFCSQKIYKKLVAFLEFEKCNAKILRIFLSILAIVS